MKRLISKSIKNNTVRKNRKPMRRSAARTIEVYDYNELSDEAKKNAVKNYRKYRYDDSDCAYNEMMLISDDINNYGLVNTYFKNSKFDALYFDWNKAWIVGEIDIEDAKKLAGVTLSNDEVYIIEDYIDYDDDYLDADKVLNLNPSIADVNSIKEEIAEDEVEVEADVKEVCEKYVKIVTKLQEVIEDINKDFTADMDFYANPDDEYLIERITEFDDVEFYEDGTLYE
jgi:hypothetical protein